MEHHKLGKRSRQNLEGVHPSLLAVTERALQLSPYDFGVLCGVRTEAEQEQRLADGSTRTKKSNHFVQLDGYSHAVDFGVYVDGQYVNGDTPAEVGYYRRVLQAFVTAAIELGVQIELGGLWRTFVDAGHVQLGKQYRGG